MIEALTPERITAPSSTAPATQPRHTCGARVEGSTDGELSTMDMTYATPAAAPAGSDTCQTRRLAVSTCKRPECLRSFATIMKAHAD